MSDSTPDQEEMDKLASVLTEAVLQLRAGDMDGARKTLNEANKLHAIIMLAEVPGHMLDALRYKKGVAELKTPIIPDRAMTATEIQQRQRIAELQLRSLQYEMVDNLNNTIIPTIKDPGA